MGRGVLRASLCALAVCALTACAHHRERKQAKLEEKTQACIDAHPRAARDPEWEAHCLRQGRSTLTCDSRTYISRQAAICIAEAAGLRRGIDGRWAHLGFDDKVDPAWMVSITTYQRPRRIHRTGVSARGRTLSVNARTGEAGPQSYWTEAQFWD